MRKTLAPIVSGVGLALVSMAPAMASAGGLVSSHPAAAQDRGEQMEAMPAAEYVGSETCAGCHDEQEYLALTPHGSEAFATLSDRGCETCHGPGSVHVEDPEASKPRFSDRTKLDQAGVCLDCHGDDHPKFELSNHAMAGISCVDCHSIHGEDGWTGDPEVEDRTTLASARITGSSAVCAQCHEDVATEFEFNERHRLQEGILDCASCHDPHQPATRARLGGFKQEACVDCHTDKGGPFVFEHGSVKVEGCVACHAPHGSPNRHQLLHQNVAELCYSCHAEVPSFHIGFGGPIRFDLDTQCTNCHSAIHGSNFDPFFLK